MRSITSAFMFLLVGCAASFAPLVNAEDDADLYSLVLIAADLYDAKQALTVYDPNEDGVVDAAEQQKLPWKNEVSRYDMNKDGKLTHLELAVRQASVRDESGSTQFDRNNARKWLRRKDSNRNGQLDPDEIAKGWPDKPDDFDTDKDGVITMSEIVAQFAFRRKTRREMGIEAVDHMEAVRLRSAYDTDKDGMLAPDEWAKANLPRDGSKYDEDGDRLLSVVEIETMLAKHRMDLGLTKSDQASARQLIRSMDFNQDGKISKDESQQGDAAFGGQPRDLSEFDGNQDGEITLAEVEKVFAERRKERGYDATHYTAAQKYLLRLDKNRSKYLESHELADEPGPGQLPADKFKAIDLNDDQRVGLDELARYLARE